MSSSYIPSSNQSIDATSVSILPPPPPTAPSPEQSTGDDNHRQIQRLMDQGFTRGLANALSNNCKNVFPLRIWVVDNSGSMNRPDGQRLLETEQANDVKIISCTRWQELQECISYHVQLSGLLQCPTTFRMLNDPNLGPNTSTFEIASSNQTPATTPTDIQNALTIMNGTVPSGVTPLVRHITEILPIIKSMSPQLSMSCQKVAIILATDGLPTNDHGQACESSNQEFVSTLKLLEGLPVWVVIRLCTDSEQVVEFYNNLDNQLEVSVEVLDDFVGEAQEVYRCNDWLNYALPLHRMREMGFHDRLLDMLDERLLTVDEMWRFCGLLFGDMTGVPDPSLDWVGFLDGVGSLLRAEQEQWNPVKKKNTPWIDLNKLNQKYGPNPTPCGCTIS